MSAAPYVLKPAEIERFERQGYLGPFTAFTPEEIAERRRAIVERVLPPFTPGKYNRASRRHLDSLTIFKLCSARAIAGRVSSLLGPDLVLWGSNLFHKPPERAEEYPWHCDSQFWQLEPMVTISAWLALTPATLENGCVEVVPGSHQQDIPWILDDSDRYTQRFWGRTADPAYFNEADKVPMVLTAGQFFLFKERLLHRSGPNRTQEFRLGLGIRFTTPSVAVKENVDCILLQGRDRFGLNPYVKPPADDPISCSY